MHRPGEELAFLAALEEPTVRPVTSCPIQRHSLTVQKRLMTNVFHYMRVRGRNCMQPRKGASD